MSMQHTMLSHFLTCLAVACVLVFSCENAGAVGVDTTSADTLLGALGRNIRTLSIHGRLSTIGSKTMSGIPFDAHIVEDTMQMSTSGPFGLTATSIYAEPDSFVAVNYFMRQAYLGCPDSPSLARDLPIPLTVTDLRMLMLGRLPGKLRRFQRSTPRKDSSVLFMSQGAGFVEYALVDSVACVLRQYQRKDSSGLLVMDITFGDVHKLCGISVPYAVDVAFDDRKETVSFRFLRVEINEPHTGTLNVTIPASFTRKTYR